MRALASILGHWLAFALSTLIVLGILGVAPSCAPSSGTWQDGVSRWTRLPRDGNPVAFGSSIASETSQDEALAYLDGVVRGRLPGVRFYLVRFPAWNPETGQPCTSYRDPYHRLIVLSWWPRTGRPGRNDPNPAPCLLPSGTWCLGDASWEVEHMIAGTDDFGRPILR